MKKNQAAREERFIASYLRTQDATKSAIEAGYSAKTAKQIGHMIMKRPHVAARLAQKQAVLVEKFEMSAERVQREIFALATLDISDCFDDNGLPIPIKQLPPHVRACIKEVNVVIISDKAVRADIKFHDKVGALKLAAGCLSLLAPKEVNVNVRFPHAHLTDDELRHKMLQAAKEQLTP